MLKRDFFNTRGCEVCIYTMGYLSIDTDSPPPIVVKLRSSETRICIMKSKKEATFGPTPAEKELGCKFFAIAEDLTQPAFKKLKELKNHEDVAKV